jgi:hypothetical protein
MMRINVKGKAGIVGIVLGVVAVGIGFLLFWGMNHTTSNSLTP